DVLTQDLHRCDSARLLGAVGLVGIHWAEPNVTARTKFADSSIDCLRQASEIGTLPDEEQRVVSARLEAVALKFDEKRAQDEKEERERAGRERVERPGWSMVAKMEIVPKVEDEIKVRPD